MPVGLDAHNGPVIFCRVTRPVHAFFEQSTLNGLHMNSLFSRLSLALLGTCLACAAHAATIRNDGIDTSASIEKDIQHFVVNADGTFSMTLDEDVKINEARSIGYWAQYPLSYNQTLEKVEILKAYTQKADGRRVTVQPSQIKDQQEVSSAEAPMFQDTRVKVLIFPEVAVGDHIVLQYKLTRTKPLFPGQFEDLYVPPFHPTKGLEIIYDMPSNIKLYADNVGFSQKVAQLDDQRTRYHWTYVPSNKARQENGSVAYTDYGDHLAVSTFADYASFAKAYDERARDKMAVTPKIQALAKQITTGLNDPRAKALALGNWVRKQIRYVAVYVGPGGVVPHEAEQVLENRYGDCKDHTALLGALLTAAGIDNTPALINARNAYRLPKVPTLGVMNHVINYVPSLNLYLDSTAESIAAGYLPISDLDKPTLLSKSGQIGHTPATQVSKLVASTEFKVDQNGAASIHFQDTLSGWLAEMNRFIARNTKPDDLDRSVQGMLGAYGMKGEGKFAPGQTDAKNGSYTVGIEGRAENMAYLPGPFGIPTITNLMGGLKQIVSGLTSEKERTQPFICLGADATEESRYDFPGHVDVIALPKPLALNNAYIDYQSSFEREGSSVVVKRHFRFHHTSSVCSAEDYQQMRQALDQVIRDLRSQIIVKA